MAKNDYISDNLITMRDRLRESTAAIREAAEQKKNTVAGDAHQPEVREEAPPQNTASLVDRRVTEGLQAKLDLAGRLAKDLAKISVILAGEERKIGELQKLEASLQTLSQTLEQTTPENFAGRFAAETDRLRLEYFRLCGALEALTASPGSTAGKKTEEHTGQNTDLRGAWIIGGAILIGAAVIAGITAAIFL